METTYGIDYQDRGRGLTLRLRGLTYEQLLRDLQGIDPVLYWGFVNHGTCRWAWGGPAGRERVTVALV